MQYLSNEKIYCKNSHGFELQGPKWTFGDFFHDNQREKTVSGFGGLIFTHTNIGKKGSFYLLYSSTSV